MFIQTHELWHLLHEKAEAQDRNIASDFESEVIKICEYGINLAKQSGIISKLILYMMKSISAMS